MYEDGWEATNTQPLPDMHGTSRPKACWNDRTIATNKPKAAQKMIARLSFEKDIPLVYGFDEATMLN
jgi:hypothetical protein